MKKTLLMLVIATGIFSACDKEDLRPPSGGGNQPGTIPVTFKKDSSAVDVTIQAPKNNHLSFSGIFYTGSINSFNLTGVKIKMRKGGDAMEPFEYVKRIRLVVEGNFSGVPFSFIKDSVNSNEFTISNFVINFAPYHFGNIKIYPDILSGATNGSGLADELMFDVELIYTGYLGNNSTISHLQTPIVSGHKTIFSTTPQSFVVSSVADPTTPTSGIILDGQEKEALRYGVKLTGVSGTVTEHRLLVQGPATNAVTSLKLFDGTNFVAQATVSGGVATILTNDALSAGIQKNYVVKPVVSVTSGDVSNYDFTITLDAVKATSTAGEQKADGTDRSGNPFRVLKTTLIVERIAITTQVINDSTEADTYHLRVTNTGNFPASFTQISYGLVWADNSPGSIDTLQLKPRLLCNNVQPSGLWTDQNGDTTVGSFFKEATSVITFTFTTEYNIQPGASVIVMLKTFRKGFKTVNDGFKIRPVFDGARIDQSYKFINQGTVGLSRKMFNTSSQSSNANPYKQLFIYSDQADPSHSPVPGLSSNDWINGFGFPTLPEQVWVR